ncbi:hypothetical protein HZA57_01045 [Candidatus Poribacteria bacterium]|nr:hypothetical protein [Candidatus Poribacteria bacterium]
MAQESRDPWGDFKPVHEDRARKSAGPGTFLMAVLVMMVLGALAGGLLGTLSLGQRRTFVNRRPRVVSAESAQRRVQAGAVIGAIAGGVITFALWPKKGE